MTPRAVAVVALVGAALVASEVAGALGLLGLLALVAVVAGVAWAVSACRVVAEDRQDVRLRAERARMDRERVA